MALFDDKINLLSSKGLFDDAYQSAIFDGVDIHKKDVVDKSTKEKTLKLEGLTKLTLTPDVLSGVDGDNIRFPKADGTYGTGRITTKADEFNNRPWFNTAETTKDKQDFTKHNQNVQPGGDPAQADVIKSDFYDTNEGGRLDRLNSQTEYFKKTLGDNSFDQQRLFDHGEKTKADMLKQLHESAARSGDNTEEGYANAYYKSVGQDKYGRDIVEFYDAEGNSIADQFNTPEYNVAYDHKSNYKNIGRDLDAAKEQRIADKALREDKAILTDEQSDTLVGKAVNTGLAFIEGEANLVGTFLSAPKNLNDLSLLIGNDIEPLIGSETAITNTLGDNGKAEYMLSASIVRKNELDRMSSEKFGVDAKAVKLTDEEHAFLKSGRFTELMQPGEPMYTLVAEKYDAGRFLNSLGEGIKEGGQGIANTKASGEVTKKLVDRYNELDFQAEPLTSTAKFAATLAGEIVTNPTVAIQEFAKSAPMIISASTGIGAVANLGAFTAENAAESVDIYRKEFKRDPTTEEVQLMMALGGLAASFDIAAGKFITGQKIMPKKLKDSLGKFADKFKIESKVLDKLIATKGFKVASAVGKGANVVLGKPAVEGGQEVLQEALVIGVGIQSTDFDQAQQDQLVTAGVLGALGGQGGNIYGVAKGAKDTVAKTPKRLKGKIQDTVAKNDFVAERKSEVPDPFGRKENIAEDGEITTELADEVFKSEAIITASKEVMKAGDYETTKKVKDTADESVTVELGENYNPVEELSQLVKNPDFDTEVGAKEHITKVKIHTSNLIELVKKLPENNAERIQAEVALSAAVEVMRRGASVTGDVTQTFFSDEVTKSVETKSQEIRSIQAKVPGMSTTHNEILDGGTRTLPDGTIKRNLGLNDYNTLFNQAMSDGDIGAAKAKAKQLSQWINRTRLQKPEKFKRIPQALKLVQAETKLMVQVLGNMESIINTETGENFTAKLDIKAADIEVALDQPVETLPTENVTYQDSLVVIAPNGAQILNPEALKLYSGDTKQAEGLQVAIAKVNDIADIKEQRAYIKKLNAYHKTQQVKFGVKQEVQKATPEKQEESGTTITTDDGIKVEKDAAKPVNKEVQFAARKYIVNTPIEELFNIGSSFITNEDFTSIFTSDKSASDTANALMGYFSLMGDMSKDDVMDLRRFSLGFARSLPKLRDLTSVTASDIRFFNNLDPVLGKLRDSKTGVLPDEVLFVIYLNSQSWLAFNGSGTLNNDTSEINKILGRDTKAKVEPNEYRDFSEIGMLRKNMINRIGADSSINMEYRQQKNAPEHTQAYLNTALGNIGFAFLIETGQIVENTKEYENDAGEPKKTKFVKIATTDGKISAKHKAKNKTVANAINVLNSLGMGFSQMAEPTTQPVVTSQVKSYKNYLDLNKDQIKQLNELNSVSFNFTDAIKPLLSTDITREQKINFLRGLVDYTYDVDNTLHITKRESAKAKNRGLDKEIQDLLDYAERYDTEQEFYFEHAIKGSGRFHTLSNTLDYQSSTLHRFFMAASDAKRTLGLTTEHKALNTYKIQMSLLFGLKETKPMQEHLDNFDKQYQNAKPMLDELQDVTSLKSLKAINDYLKSIGEQNPEAFEAILDMHAYNEAIKAGTPLTTSITAETDGITNGSAIGFMQFPLLSDMDSWLERVGIFKNVEGGPKHYTDWRQQPGTRDSYESIVEKFINSYANKSSTDYMFGDQPGADAKGNTIDSLSKRLVKFKGVKPAQKDLNNLAALTDILIGKLTEGTNEELAQKLVNNQAFDISKDGRDLAKYPFMIFGFGGGRAAIQERIADIMVEELYSKITEAANTRPGSKKRIQLSEMLGIDIVNASKKQVLKTVLPKKTEDMLQFVFKNTVGRGMVDSIEASLDGFVDAKETLNQVINVTARVYIEKFTAEIDKRVGEKGYVSKEDIIAVQDKIKNILPKIRGIDSKSNTEGLGLLKEQEVFSDDIIHKIQTAYNSKVVLPGDKAPRKSNVSNILLKEFTDPGVSGLVKAIHSLDATIMAKAQVIAKRQGVAGAHIFDASMGDSRFSKIYNKVFFETMRDYSITDDVMRTYRVAQIIAREDNMDIDAMTEAVLTQDGKFEGPGVNAKEFTDLAEKLEKKIKLQKAEMFANEWIVDQMTFPDNESGYETGAEVKLEIKANESDLNSDQGAIDTATFVATDVKAATSATVINIFQLFKASAHKFKSKDYSDHLQYLVSDVIAPGIKSMDKIIVNINQKAKENFGQVSSGQVYINTSPKHKTLSGKDGEEVYVHELLHVLSSAAIKDSSNGIYKKIKTLHKLVKDNNLIKPTDFIPTGVAYTAAELKSAQATYDYMFSSKNKSNIDEFFVHVLSNEQMRKKLSIVGTNIRDKTFTKDETPFDKFLGIMETIVLWVQRVASRTKADNISDEMLEIAINISRLNNRTEHKIFSNTNKVGKMLNDVAAKVGDYSVDAVKGISDRIGNSEVGAPLINKVLAIPGKVIRNARAIKAEPEDSLARRSVVKSVNTIANTFSDPTGNFRKLASEVLGPKPELQAFFELLRYSKKKIDSDRKDVATITKQDILDNIETTMSKADKVAATKVLIRTDITQLLDRYSIDEIVDMLTDQALINTKIADIESQLAPNANSAMYGKFSKALGNYMVHGEGIHNIAFSAINIARGATVGKAITYTEPTVKLIDTLASLEALRLTSAKDKQAISDFYYREDEANQESNGFTNIMDIIKGVKQKALEKNFSGNESLMMKGHFAQIQDPNTQMKVALASDEKALLEEGFIKQGDNLPQDSADMNNGEPLALYVATNSYMINTVKGIMSQSNLHNVGTKLSSNEVVQSYGVYNQIQIKLRTIAVRDAHTVEALKSASEQTHLVPLHDRAGNIVDYRYIMNTENKEKYLDIDYSIENVLGKMQADIVNKSNTDAIHKDLGVLLKQDFNNHYKDMPSDFIRISEEVTPDIYRLIPTKMRKDLKRKFANKIMVRREMLDAVFGYRKASLINISYKNRQLIPKRIQKYVKIAEAVWQTIIANEKVNIVIKTPQVLIENVISNSIILLVNGITPLQALKDYKEALVSLKDYSEDHTKLVQDQIKLDGLDAKDPRRARIQARVNTRQNYLDNNPINKLIDEGLFQGITEDVEISNYGIKADLLNKLNTSIVGKVTPSIVKKAANQLYMSEGTPLFQLLLKATQQSDFIARYSLFKHNIKKGVDEKKALQTAVDTFINYDAPHTKEVQYLNDIGLFMFTKFFVRIQRVIAKQLTENTSRSVLGILLQYGFGDISDILDTSLVDTDITARMYPNPWDHIMGALDFKLLDLLGL